MVQINFATREVNCKIVYYGCGRCGKTTNLQVVHAKAPNNSTGELVSIATETDRTLYFDFLPLDLGTVAGMRTKFSLYTVPGQVYYDATRKLVLQGADGVVFVVDSNPDLEEENVESLDNLAKNLKENGLDINTLPVVLQWNKRDLPNAMSIERMNAKLNRQNWPTVEAVAVNGDGVFKCLKIISQQVIKKLNREQGYSDDGQKRGAAPSASRKAPAAPPPPKAPPPPPPPKAPAAPKAAPAPPPAPKAAPPPPKAAPPPPVAAPPPPVQAAPPPPAQAAPPPPAQAAPPPLVAAPVAQAAPPPPKASPPPMQAAPPPPAQTTPAPTTNEAPKPSAFSTSAPPAPVPSSPTTGQQAAAEPSPPSSDAETELNPVAAEIRRRKQAEAEIQAQEPAVPEPVATESGGGSAKWIILAVVALGAIAVALFLVFGPKG